MRALCCILILALSGSLSPRAAFDPDSDGDGQTDSQELAAGTDPANEFSVRWTSLAAWRFSDSLADQRGGAPIASSGAAFSEGIDGPGLHLTGSSSFVRYRSVEADGTVKVAPRQGSIWFYVKPDWFSDLPEPPTQFTDLGNGPGHWATVLETENFKLSFNPAGTELVLTSRAADGSTLTNLTLSLQIRSLDVRPSRDLPGFPLWYNGLLTYTPNETRLYWLRPGNSMSGPGIAPSTVPPEERQISIGSNLAGGNPLGGVIDEVITFNALGAFSVNSWLYSAVPSEDPPGINLVWNSPTNTLVNIERRLRGEREWTWLGAALGSSFLDTTAVEGVRYEYKFNTRLSSSFGDIEPFGYIAGGVRNGLPIEDRGKVILLVDQTLSSALEPDLSGFIQGLIGDGWQVLRRDVPRHLDDYSTQTSFQINALNIANEIMPFIRESYTQHGASIRQILILGHVPIPYSGTFADDGHYFTGQHQGAWATDLYYGDMNGIWTDNQTLVNSFFPWNWNYPGDGKFDQDFIPLADGRRDLEIPVARIDLANLPAFAPRSEVDLLRQYLQKNAAFRSGATPYPPAALAFDTHVLGRFSEVPMQIASSIGAQLAVLGAPAVADPFGAAAPALAAAVSGPGGFDVLNYLTEHEHSTAEFASGESVTPAAFYYVRSSYMPDWNSTNNFLRAILATPGGGLSVGGMFIDRTWRAVGLGLGDTLGSDVTDVVNNWTARQYTVRPLELLGDATLRYPVIPPPSAVAAFLVNERVLVTWTSSPDPEAEYHVYRSTAGPSGGFERISAEPLNTESFIDDSPPIGNLVYMVRSVALSTTGGGTFTNLSQGTFSLSIGSSSCCIDDQSMLEDQGPLPVDFQIGGQASSSNVELTGFSSDPSIVPVSGITFTGTGNSRTALVTPAPDAFGTVLITIAITTSEGTTQQGFWLAIHPVNDTPGFTRGANQFTPSGAGPRQVSGWATDISAGPFESEQTVVFSLLPDRPEVFTEGPSISSDGTLSFSLAEEASGNVRIQVRAHDDGGTGSGGADTSPAQEFIISIGSPLDTDEDGLPDDFETANGFNPLSAADGAADNDGDGFRNVQEYWAGTDPFDSTSLLEIHRTILDESGWRFQFLSVQGQDYTVEYNDSFPTGPWQLLIGMLSGSGSNIEVADAAGYAARTNRIYRVLTGDGRGNTVSSGYAGFHRLSAPGSAVSFYSQAFIRPPEARGRVEAVQGHVLTISGAPPWTLNRWLNTGTQTNQYYLMICSGVREGEYFPIAGNTQNQVGLDLQGRTLAGLSLGDRIMIVPYWTLGSIFPGGRDVHQSPGFFFRPTELFLPDLAGTGINLSSKGTYFYSGGMWQEFSRIGVNRNSIVILPEMFVRLRHNVATNTTLTSHGAVLHTKFRVPLRRRTAGEQDNYVALPRPGSMTLRELGLIESGAFRASPGFFFRVDELFLFTPTPAGASLPSVGTFYHDSTWKKFGQPSDFSDIPVFAPGSGMTLRLDASADSVIWLNEPNY